VVDLGNRRDQANEVSCLAFGGNPTQISTEKQLYIHNFNLCSFLAQIVMPKPQGSPDVTRSVRCAIVTLRLVSKWDFARIARALGQKKSTCSLVVRRAIERVGNNDILEILDFVERENAREASGFATVKVQPGSTESVVIQDACWWFPKETWVEAVQTHTPFGDLSVPTIARICREHPHPSGRRPLTRVAEQFKPSLSPDLLDLRREYVEWALDWLQRDA